jgi:serine protease Do
MCRIIYKSSLQKICWWPVVMMALSILCAVVLALAGNVVTAYADSVPGGNITSPAVRAVDIAEPAVVRIFTETSGQLTVNFSANNSVAFPQGSGKTYQITLSGSGTFISANGDILTADHVVNPPPEELQQIAAPDVSAYIDSHPELGLGQVTSDQVTQLLLSGQLKSTANYGPKQSAAFLSTAYTGPLSATNMNQIPVSIQSPITIEKESAVNQDDTAIIHTTFTDTPSVQLGDSSTVQQQDQLNIIGFPGNGDVSNTNPTDLLTSSVNTINVSAVKTSDTGAPLIQVGGNVEQGDSGGPALNMSGNVVGIVSFSLVATPGSTSFLQASNSARNLIKSLNLNTTPGKFQTLWSQAFDDYASTAPGHWHKAAQEFQQLASSYPQFKAVNKYLDYAQTQAKTEKAPAATATATSKPVASTGSKVPSPSIMAIAATAGAVLLVILLVVALFAVMVRQRGKKKKNVAVTTPEKPAINTPPAQIGPGAVVKPSGTPPQRAQTPVPPPAPSARPGTGMQAFGAPPSNRQVSAPPPAAPGPRVQQMLPPQQTTTPLRIWPCGHMNRPNARFCSICGEPAPEPPTTIRHVEQ